MEKQPRPALLPEVPLALGEAGEALGLWQPRPCLLPPSARWDAPHLLPGGAASQPGAWHGELLPSSRVSPTNLPASLLGFLPPRPHRWWRQAATRGRGLGEAGTGSPRLPPQRRVGSAVGTHATWLLTKDHRRATQTDVSHHIPAFLEPSDRPLDKMLTHGALLVGAQRHGGPGSRPSPPGGRAPKQTLSPSPVPRGGRGTLSAVSVHRGVTHSVLRSEQKRTPLFTRATAHTGPEAEPPH